LANDGVHAIEQLRGTLAHDRPLLILADIEMPRMDGFEMVRALKADSELKDLPIAMITSRLAEKHRDVAASLGVNHYFGKPYVEQDLLAFIAGFSENADAAIAG
jgi:chemosensory pili system protein ChpA (sensor histidine kinase/response regulator)